ncbi:unnamed protein product [Phytomonas sp. Hart1]|nr:unnamed protein product [Phytomonas sp. Hart1]|eukprot:CCW69056.1 unnamed protein product [Phytomonas sp. isolate Hart1]
MIILVAGDTMKKVRAALQQYQGCVSSRSEVDFIEMKASEAHRFTLNRLVLRVYAFKTVGALTINTQSYSELSSIDTQNH